MDPKDNLSISWLQKLSFKYDCYLTWFVIIISVFWIFYPPAGNLNYLLLVMDICLFILNNHLLMGKKYNLFTEHDFTLYKVGNLGSVIFLLKLIPILNYLYNNTLKYINKKNRSDFYFGLMGTFLIILVALLNYIFAFSYLF